MNIFLDCFVFHYKSLNKDAYIWDANGKYEVLFYEKCNKIKWFSALNKNICQRGIILIKICMYFFLF